MDALSRYLEQVKPKRYVILGIVLRPFCIGHYLHLAEQNSVFIQENERRITFEDLKKERFWIELLLALTVCRHTYEEFDEIMSNKDLLDAEIRTVNAIAIQYVQEQRKESKVKTKFRQFVNSAFCLKHFGKKWLPDTDFDPLEAFVEFRKYLETGYKVPEWDFNHAETKTKTSITARKKGPSKHFLAQTTEDLMQKTNRTLSEIRNMPMNEANLAWATAAENEGHITLLDDEEIAWREQMNAAGDNNLRIEGVTWDELVADYKQQGGILADG